MDLKQYEEQEFVGVGAPTSSKQDGHKNDFSVYNIDFNIYKDVGTSNEDVLINTLKVLVKIFDDFFGDLMKKPRNSDYTLSQGCSIKGISQSYWTTFARVIKREGFCQRNGC